MTYSVRYTASAIRDLAEIADYLDEEAGVQISTSVIKRIRRQVETLKRDAHRYRERLDLGPGCRALLIGSYVAIYKFDGGEAFVLRVLHGARNITPEMLE